MPKKNEQQRQQQPTYDELKAENIALRKQLDDILLKKRGKTNIDGNNDDRKSTSSSKYLKCSHTLTNDQIRRYGRQLILPEFGTDAQSKVCNTKVLVIGAGGLGSPICLYLAAGGVGTIGIVDGDTVDTDNLHRQIIHQEHSRGMNKAESARNACVQLNSSIDIRTYPTHFTSANAMSIAKSYDILVDATDNVATRYLINDIAIMCKKPLVSGSALRFEGQITVYGYKGGPCYRCLFPVPPPPNTVTNCNDGGVLGPIPGLIGCMQALEVLKIAGDMSGVLSQKLVMYDGASNRFLNVKLRTRRHDCDVCGDTPKITTPIDYVQFCGSAANDDHKQHDEPTPPPHDTIRSISCMALFERLNSNDNDCVLLDVREPVQYKICSLKHSINIPLSQLEERSNELFKVATKDIYVMCRRGVFSRIATELLCKLPIASKYNIMNVSGGLAQWQRKADTSFPIY